MTAQSLSTLFPYIILAGTAVAVMLLIAFVRNHGAAAFTTVAGMALTLVTLPIARESASRQVTPLLRIDDFALFYSGLIVSAGLVVAVLSYTYLKSRGNRNEEYYVLLLCATLGAALLTASTHFASLFLSLEILSVSLYAMIAYPRTQANSIEAAVKYLVLAAGSAAFLLFGMALVYAELGTMDFARIAVVRNSLDQFENLILLAGMALMTAGIGFKLALAPFHWWTPDVYEGAPAPVTAFVATVSKGAMFAVLLRFFTQVDVHSYPPVFALFCVISVASMFVGNLLALLQDNVKRILAYSSIAHLGYLLVAFLASGPLAATAAAFYLVSYFLTTLGAFGIVTLMSSDKGLQPLVLFDAEREADSIEDYRGLFWRRPWIATLFTTVLLSLAGIPLTAGFVGKFYILAAGEASARWIPVFMLVLNSAIGLFYYLRIVVAMCAPAPESTERARGALQTPLPLLGGAAVSAVTLALVWFGVYPAPLIRLVESLVTSRGVLP